MLKHLISLMLVYALKKISVSKEIHPALGDMFSLCPLITGCHSLAKGNRSLASNTCERTSMLKACIFPKSVTKWDGIFKSISCDFFHAYDQIDM